MGVLLSFMNIEQLQDYIKLRRELHEIVDMCMGDGLDYCRSLTDPKPMEPHELESHAAVLAGCFMGIAHKARSALAFEGITPALASEARHYPEIPPDPLGFCPPDYSATAKSIWITPLRK
jgi:hypothetical protein